MTMRIVIAIIGYVAFRCVAHWTDAGQALSFFFGWIGAHVVFIWLHLRDQYETR